jgi:hypothetical protein
MADVGGLLCRVATHVEEEASIDGQEAALPQVDRDRSAATAFHLADRGLDHPDPLSEPGLGQSATAARGTQLAAELRQVLLVSSRSLRLELRPPESRHIAAIVALRASLPITWPPCVDWPHLSPRSAGRINGCDTYRTRPNAAVP